ncbi:MAG: hypothetical protein JWQ11_739 [Rhizobacter sp.]|nr:hypothetical protein [Rhizobacter sp.]
MTAARVGEDLVLTVSDSGAGLASDGGPSSSEPGKSGEPGEPGDSGDPGDGASTAGSHFGLVQVRQRLSTLYGDAARLELKDRATLLDRARGPDEPLPPGTSGMGAAPSGTVAIVTIALKAIAQASAALQ